MLLKTLKSAVAILHTTITIIYNVMNALHAEYTVYIYIYVVQFQGSCLPPGCILGYHEIKIDHPWSTGSNCSPVLITVESLLESPSLSKVILIGRVGG